MKKRKISDISELPVEFDPSKYNELNRLSIFDWLHLIEIRFHLNRRINSQPTDIELDGIKEEIIKLLDKPLPITRSIITEKFSDQSQKEPIENTHGVRSLDMFSIMSIANDHKAHGAAIDAYKKYIAGDSLTEQEREILRTPSYITDNAPISFRATIATTTIDLAVPDKTLIANFSNWLKSIRSQTKTDPNKIGKWKESMRIPTDFIKKVTNACAVEYVDLFLWLKANDLEITDEACCEAILATTKRSISETTEKWASWLLSAKTIDTLNSHLISKPL